MYFRVKVVRDKDEIQMVDSSKFERFSNPPRKYATLRGNTTMVHCQFGLGVSISHLILFF